MKKPWRSMGSGLPVVMFLQILGAALLFWMWPAWAQTPAKTSAAATEKSRSASVKDAKAQAQAKATASKNAPSVKPDTLMGPEELAIAERVHQGQLVCELGASVRLKADPSSPGYFNLHGKGFSYWMHPVTTSTGAIRLEDRKAGAVWLQLSNKSMLMDQKKGRRMADGCANAEQVAYAEHMKSNPPPSLFDATGMGR